MIPSKKQTLESYQQRILKVLNYIRENLDEPLNLEQLAKQAYFSPHHFHRIFSKMVGEPVKAYVKRLKLQRALFEIATTEKSITHIALDAGFQSIEAFSRCIKKDFGHTPSELREQGQQLLKEMRSRYKGKPLPKVSIQQLAPIDIAYVRHTGPYEEATNAWLKLVELTSLNAVISKDAWRIGIAYDLPALTPPGKCRYDACVLWQEDYEEKDGLARRTIAGGKYAVVEHIGPIEKIGDTYEAFFCQAMPQMNLHCKEAPSFMRYVKASLLGFAGKQVTEIYFPLQD